MRELKNKGFTLLELLIVIAVLAILSVVVVLVLNPAETLRKARDSQRMADLNTIKTAIGLYITSTSTPYLGNGGNTNTGCIGSGSTYIWYSQSGPAHGSSSGSVDGTGWVPVNLSSLTGGSPISNWPIDPINSVSATPTSTDLVYRYGCNSSNMTFEVNAKLESDAYTVQENKAATDGGNNSSLYEIGTNLTVLGSGTNF